MGSFTNGVLVGVGLSLLLAPKPGKETRSLLSARFRSLRGLPSEQEDLKPPVQETPFAAPARTTLPGGAYFPPTNTASVQSDLSSGVPVPGVDIPQTGLGDLTTNTASVQSDLSDGVSVPGVDIPQTGLGDPSQTQPFRRVRSDQDPNRT